jgi:hypothetical protein
MSATRSSSTRSTTSSPRRDSDGDATAACDVPVRLCGGDPQLQSRLLGREVGQVIHHHSTQNRAGGLPMPIPRGHPATPRRPSPTSPGMRPRNAILVSRANNIDRAIPHHPGIHWTITPVSLLSPAVHPLQLSPQPRVTLLPGGGLDCADNKHALRFQFTRAAQTTRDPGWHHP